MKIFSNDNQLAERLESTEAEVAELSELVATREGEIKDLTEKVAELSTGIEAQAAQLEEAEAAMALLEAEKSEMASELASSKEAQEDFASKVNDAACAKMQELGVAEPVAQSDAHDDEGDIYSQYTKLKATNPAAAGAFWRENEAQIKALI